MISTDELPSLPSEHGQLTDQQVVGYLWTVVGKFRGRGEDNSIECILCE